MENLEALLLDRIKNTQTKQIKAFHTLQKAMDAQSVTVQQRLGVSKTESLNSYDSEAQFIKFKKKKLSTVFENGDTGSRSIN